ncbi:hypothetical protein C3B59_00040 [Cryobacterium zongtaii]|uniref:Uncharacterized protein n=1 Tax=Cryobacterium zongtaii TaxID=1259217 RepID=A0A2S3ZQS0_9MICO|nr:hypothetical protein [Cryobacterium zongtaii]POH71550.1 hypothetical protein C3B59_00040 [Cryobacterium zongtaii]
MTETPSPAPQSTAKQIAEALGVELMPWQAAVLDAHMAGERLVYVGGRRGGRSTVRALADLTDALRTPPAPAEPAPWISPIDWMLCEASGRPLIDPSMSLPLMLSTEHPHFPRVYRDYVAPEEMPEPSMVEKLQTMLADLEEGRGIYDAAGLTAADRLSRLAESPVEYRLGSLWIDQEALDRVCEKVGVVPARGDQAGGDTFTGFPIRINESEKGL